MRTEIINIYSFEELEEPSKEKARQWYRGCNQSDGYSWDKENSDSLKAFFSFFDCHLVRGGFILHNDNETGKLEGLRLYKYIMNNHYNDIYKPKKYWICDGHRNAVGTNSKTRTSRITVDYGNCPLTGYCIDCDLLQPIIDFLKKPIDIPFNDLLTWCYESWEKAVESDHEYQDSSEYIDETITVNEYEFYGNGEKY